jgi:hypothetical protein
MQSLPHILATVISEDFHFHPVERNTLRLIEEKEKLSVDIKIKTSDIISCFSFDKDKKSKADAVFPFFNSTVNGLCTKNDFILVHQKGNNVYVFLIELKSKNSNGYLKQLRAGKLFFQFVVDKIKLCNSECKDFNKYNLHYRGILFRINRGRPDKGTSRHSKLEFNKNQDLDVCIQGYDNVYYLSQFL